MSIKSSAQVADEWSALLAQKLNAPISPSEVWQMLAAIEPPANEHATLEAVCCGVSETHTL